MNFGTLFSKPVTGGQAAMLVLYPLTIGMMIGFAWGLMTEEKVPPPTRTIIIDMTKDVPQERR